MIRAILMGAAAAFALASAAFAQSAGASATAAGSPATPAAPPAPAGPATGVTPGVVGGTPPGVAGGVQPYRPAGLSGSNTGVGVGVGVGGSSESNLTAGINSTLQAGQVAGGDSATVAPASAAPGLRTPSPMTGAYGGLPSANYVPPGAAPYTGAAAGSRLGPPSSP